MFNNITKTCSGANATWEILTMLAGAFLLGCLLCWLIRKLKGMDNPPPNGTLDTSDHLIKKEFDNTQDKTTLHAKNNTTINSLTSHKETQQTHQSYKAKKVETTSPTAYGVPKTDDLKKISSVDDNIELFLRDKGVKSYTDLRDIDHQTLLSVMDTPNFNVTKQEVETWPHQSGLAAKGEWKKLSDYQDFRNRSQSALKNADPYTSKTKQSELLNDNKHRSDDLTKISGINPEFEKALNNKGIYTFAQLRASKNDTLKGHLIESNIKTEKVDTKSWIQQAALADEKQWDELEEYQDFMKIRNTNLDSLSTSNASSNESSNIKQTKTSSISQINKVDDLKKIEGIGPKIEDVLNSHGIKTFKSLHESSRNSLKSHLDKAGPQFKMHEPESWPHQAGMAYRGEWKKLKEYQDFMVGGRDDTVSLGNTSSLSESESNKSDKTSASLSTSYVDDLTKIEGIGPKIEQLLNKAGILNFAQLKSANRDHLKATLNEAGPQFKMHEPKSWPKQAEYADNKQWKKLEEYQDELIGGK